MVCSTFLNCIYHIFLCFLVCFFFGATLHFLDHHSRFMFYIFFNSLQQIFFCLFRGQTGNSLQFLYALLIQFCNLLFLFCHFFFFGIENSFSFLNGISLLVNVLFLLLNTSLKTLYFGSSLFHFFV